VEAVIAPFFTKGFAGISNRESSGDFFVTGLQQFCRFTIWRVLNEFWNQAGYEPPRSAVFVDPAHER
jgi:hypothetical protein